MKRLVVAVVAVSCLARTEAMPTQAELKKAQPLVVELMAPTMSEFKAAGAKDKAAAAVKVADSSAEFAKAAETEAAKFLLLKGAVSFYTRGEAYDPAADTLAVLLSEVKDVPPAVVAEIAGKATGRISETKAPRLFALYRKAKLQVRAASEAKSLALKLRKVKSDALQRRYAEALAVSGDWKAAYAEFAKLSDAKLKAIVEAEAKGAAKNAESGEFWWAYEPDDAESADSFKAHAVTFYRKALDADEITGLKKNIVEQRIAGCGPIVEPLVGKPSPGLFVLPKEGRGSDVTLRLVAKCEMNFVSCPKGKYTMGFKDVNSCLKKHEVSISRPFWIAKFPVTYAQWDAFIGKMPRRKGEKCQFDLDVLGGDQTPAALSYNQALQFVGKLNDRFKWHLPPRYVFRLASEAECEYVVKAGRSEYNAKNDAEGEVVSFGERLKAVQEKGYSVPDGGRWPWRVPYFAVGSRKANKWGVHDMLTCGWMYVLDSVKASKETDTEALTPFYTNGSVDPVQIYEGPGALGLVRGCGWGYDGKYQGRGWVKFLVLRGDERHDDCFLRIVVGPDIVGELSGRSQGGDIRAGSAAKTVELPTSGEGATPVIKPTGKPIVLNLTKDLAMEFVPCPAGEFEMGNSAAKESPSYRHKVKITRPFWIAKYQVTREIWQQFDSDLRLDELKIECGGMKAPMTDVSYQHVKAFCDWLQHRYRSKVKMPKDYVFRLPTEAEWEYALDAGGDLQDEYHRWLDGDDSLRSKIMITKDDYQKIMDKSKVKFPALYRCPALPVGQKEPNAWGVYDMLGNGREFVLDCVTGEGYKQGVPCRKLQEPGVVHYEDEEVDPFRYRLETKQAKGKKAVREKEERFVLLRNCADNPGADWYAKGRGVPKWGYGMNATFRLVIGPDLVSEWKAKNGKN